MSKEFEEKVLNKLDKHDKLLENLIKIYQGLDEKTQNLSDTYQGLKETCQNLTKICQENKDNILILSQNLAKHEIESSKRFGTLFDAITVHNEKNDLYDQKIFSFESKIFNHDVRISELEKKIY